MQFTEETHPFTSLKQTLMTWKVKDWLMLAIVLVGISIAGYGIWELQQLTRPMSDQLEVLADISQSTEADLPQPDITLEVAGAVVNPGLVTLPQGSRVGEAVSAAGGFHDQADSQVLNQQINLARIVQDGEKLYIPFTGEMRVVSTAEEVATKAQGDDSSALPTTASHKVSINSATTAELDELEGIGQARAASIVQNRPFATLDELVTKKVLPQSTFDAIKDFITL